MLMILRHRSVKPVAILQTRFAVLLITRCKFLLLVAAKIIMGNLYYGGFYFTKVITMEGFVISLGTNPHIVDKFQTDQFKDSTQN